MLLNVEKTIEHFRRCNVQILGPLQDVGSRYDDPVVLVSIHSCIGQNHRFSSASQASHENALARRSSVVEASKVWHFFVNFQRRRGLQLFEALSEVVGRRINLEVHDHFDSLVSDSKHIIKLTALL